MSILRFRRHIAEEFEFLVATGSLTENLKDSSRGALRHGSRVLNLRQRDPISGQYLEGVGMHRTSLSMNATLVKRALPLLLGALILVGNSPAWARSREHRIPLKYRTV
jgi:hypothetical protein